MTHHEKFKPVVVHEFGHSFAGLGDEYAYEAESISMYPRDIETWEENLTTLVNFKGKWENLVKKNTPIPTPATEKNKKTVGAYEGAGYSLKGVYRGYQDCRMRTNEFPEFCPVCTQALQGSLISIPNRPKNNFGTRSCKPLYLHYKALVQTLQAAL